MNPLDLIHTCWVAGSILPKQQFLLSQRLKRCIRRQVNFEGVSLGGVVGEKFAPSRPIDTLLTLRTGVYTKVPRPDGAEQSMVFLMGK